MKIPYLDLRQLNAECMPQIEQAALHTMRSGLYLNDSNVYEFEQSWAKGNRTKHCISTANGLDALTAALSAMKALYLWNDGSEVVVSAHTFIASFEAITRAGLMPVPCDVNITDYNINCNLIEPLINDKTVAVMPVHLYGRECDMKRIKEIANRHHLKIITDSCQRHSLDDNDNITATISDAVAFSFYPGKNLGALGDAGCLITNNTELADLARTFCNYGARIKYHHDMKGINSRMDAVQAAILNVKIPILNHQNAIRQSQAERYNQAINNPVITLPYDSKETEKSVWHIYPIFCQHRDKLQSYLSELGIGTIIHYPIPPHKQLAYREINHLSLPITEQLCATELSLPLNPTLTLEEQDYIIEALNSFQP
ncbi:MAG: DegT/DnrJ/EryC1/StrS family aminotransferase [Prevotellaceae bacterium]|nr:DegT/DnrJ/EryC1/StrS family aminotransferase [Prevotellaceae bacterium]